MVDHWKMLRGFENAGVFARFRNVQFWRDLVASVSQRRRMRKREICVDRLLFSV